MYYPIDFDRINSEAIRHLEAVCRRLLPGGHCAGHEFLALNPRRLDVSLGSFKINLRTGVWADFAVGDRGDDPISLVAYIEDCKQGEAALKLARFLGLDAGGRRREY
jgi:putative DNA primase/helicase